MAIDEPPLQSNQTPPIHSHANGSTAAPTPNGGQPHTKKTEAVQSSPGLEEKDEFGLPVKKIHRQSVGSEQCDHASKNEGTNASGHSDEKPHVEEKLAVEDAALDADTQAAKDKGKHSQNPSSPASPELNAKDLPATSSHQPTKSEAPSFPATDNILHGDTGAVSGWSQQALAPQKANTEEDKDEDEWRPMPAYAPYDLYDDDGHLIAKEAPDSDEEANAYHGLGGAGKGYTRVQHDEDAKSTTSMDENTDYLFKSKGTDLANDDEDQRDPLAQLQATKRLLTEGQRIAYVGLTRLGMAEMVKQLEDMVTTKSTKKGINLAIENMKMWSQRMMVRLYMHMDIDSSGEST